MTLIYISCAWLLGIYLGSRFSLPALFILVGLLPLVLLVFSRHHLKTVILTSICLVTLLVATLYFPFRLPSLDESSLQSHNERGEVTLQGLVNTQPEPGANFTRLRFSTRAVKHGSQWQEAQGTALIYVPAHTDYRYGDVLLVSGNPETPPQLDDFDYKAYLALQDIHTIIFHPRVEIDRKSVV